MKMYTSKSNAKRAAKKAMGTDSVEGKHWLVQEKDGQFAWTPSTSTMPEKKQTGNLGETKTGRHTGTGKGNMKDVDKAKQAAKDHGIYPLVPHSTKPKTAQKDAAHKIADITHVKRGFMKQFADYVAKQGTVTREQMVQHFKTVERKRVLHYWYWSKSHGILVPAA